MSGTKKHILLIEPYYGGSHKAFLQGLQSYVNLEFTLLSLPARKWKMRMQVSAPWFAGKVVDLVAKGAVFDAIMTSTFIDAAVLRSLLAEKGLSLPLSIYFHENQFAYPAQVQDPAFHQFTNINWTSALVADRLYFNSKFNLDSFLTGIVKFLSKVPDLDLQRTVERIRDKSSVLFPGIDCAEIDQDDYQPRPCRQPVIVWNHRWEHDKDPDTFFNTLFRLQREQVDFKLIVLGQRFRNQPEIFAKARERLAEHILHFGFVRSRKRYAALLRQGDIVVSTARHEFFGIAVLEAVRAGCRPLVPDRLSYRELYPPDYRYRRNELFDSLQSVLDRKNKISRKENMQLTQGFSWPEVAHQYQRQLTDFFD